MHPANTSNRTFLKHKDLFLSFEAVCMMKPNIKQSDCFSFCSSKSHRYASQSAFDFHFKIRYLPFKESIARKKSFIKVEVSISHTLFLNMKHPSVFQGQNYLWFSNECLSKQRFKSRCLFTSNTTS